MRQLILTGIGGDPEFFLQNKKTKEFVSAEGFVMGTKEHPLRFDLYNNMFGIQLDNCSVEVNIPPTLSAEEFWNNIQKGAQFINSILPKDLCVVAIPAVNFDEKYLQTENAKTFGCSPDVSAYTQWLNTSPKADDITLRSAGGHICIGYNNPFQMFNLKYPDEEILNADIERQQIIKLLDLHVSIPNVILEPNNKRKELYGKAGAYRPTPYGVEYRTPSNFYLATKKLTYTIYKNVIMAINAFNKGLFIDKELGEFVQKTINTNNSVDANYLIKFFKLKLS